MAAGEDDGQEKSLDPTPQKLQRAREKGDIPRSTDANAAASYVALLLALMIGGGVMASQVAAPLSKFLADPHGMAILLFNGDGGAEVFTEIAIGVSPLLLAPAAAALISLIAQNAIVVAPSKLEPQLSRISPISNAAQKFGVQGLVEFGKSLVKLTAISVVIVWIFLSKHDGLHGLMQTDGRMIGGMLLEEIILILGATSVIAVVIAAFDVPYQQFEHFKKMRMSVQELKEELKESEGDPFVKQARQQRAREIATNQMLGEVPKADVVIVNPTHYAVALSWSRRTGEAPVCVAKGVDEIARKIREIAVENEVPIHRDPPTARALHATVEIGDEIREDHYQAVAAAIRFADALRAKLRASKVWRTSEE